MKAVRATFFESPDRIELERKPTVPNGTKCTIIFEPESQVHVIDPAWQICTISSVVEFLQLVKTLYDPNNPLMFRGQANSEWGLLSGLDRHLLGQYPDGKELAYDEWLAMENDLLNVFDDKTKYLLGMAERAAFEPTNDDGIVKLTVMQHYGGPTRLLDWTRSPTLALLIACLGDPNTTGTVWWCREKTLNDQVGNAWKSYGIVHKDQTEAMPRGRVRVWEEAFHRDSKPFLCQIYSYPFERITIQQGFFTMAGRLGEYHDDLIANLLRDKSQPGCPVLGRINISNVAHQKGVLPKNEILEELQIMGIAASTFFSNTADLIGSRMNYNLEKGLKYD